MINVAEDTSLCFFQLLAIVIVDLFVTGGIFG